MYSNSQMEIFFRILSLSIFPPFRIPFIFSLRYFKNVNTNFLLRTCTGKNKVIYFIHYYFIQEHLRIFSNII